MYTNMTFKRSSKQDAISLSLTNTHMMYLERQEEYVAFYSSGFVWADFYSWNAVQSNKKE